MLIVRVFCCDCSIKSAAVVAAVLNAVYTGLLFIASLCMWEVAMHKSDSDGGKIFVGLGFATFFAGFIALGILLSLIRAIIKQIPNLLLPWLIGDIINIVMQFGELIAAIINAGVGLSPLAPIGVQVALLSFEIYLWIVMHNYYTNMKCEVKRVPSSINQNYVEYVETQPQMNPI